MTNTDTPVAWRIVPGEPKFGDIVENLWASEANPTRRGIFVRKFRRKGRLNAGLTYEITDGKGLFWTIQPSAMEDRPLKITRPAAPAHEGLREGIMAAMSAGLGSNPSQTSYEKAVDAVLALITKEQGNE